MSITKNFQRVEKGCLLCELHLTILKQKNKTNEI